MKIQEAIKLYLNYSNSHKDNKTVEWERQSLVSFTKFCNTNKIQTISKLSEDIFFKYQNYERNRNITALTINKKVRLIFRVLNFHAVDTQKEFSKVKNQRVTKKVRERLSDDQLKEFSNYLKSLDDNIGNNLIYKAYFNLLYYIGARADEALNIKIKNINLKDRSILLEKTKYSKERVVNFLSDLTPIISKLIKLSMTGYLFTNVIRGRQLNYRDIKYFYDKAKKAGLDYVGSHIFRHTFASTCVDNGMPITDLQNILGHSNLATTYIYVHANKDKQKESYDKYFIPAKLIK